MSDKIVIIRSDDNIEYWDYHGFATIKKAIIGQRYRYFIVR